VHYRKKYHPIASAVFGESVCGVCKDFLARAKRHFYSDVMLRDQAFLLRIFLVQYLDESNPQ